MQSKSIYVPIPVSERLPSEIKSYPTIIANGFIGERYLNKVDGIICFHPSVVFWLEKQEMIIMSEEELNGLVEKTYNEGFHDGVK